MGNLLKLEMRKLSRQKSLYFCLVIMIFLILLDAIIYKVLMNSEVDIGDLATQLKLYNMSGIFFTLATISNADFFLIMGIIVAIIYCYDFEEQTVKNVFVKGYSRNALYFSKIISILCATLILFVGSFLFSFIIGTIFFGVGEGSILTMLGMIGLQLLVSFAYSLFFTLICVLCRKFVRSIIMTIVTPLVLTLVANLIDAIINSSKFKVFDYFMDGMIINLTSLSPGSTYIIIGIVCSVVYMAIFTLLGAIFSKKIEV